MTIGSRIMEDVFFESGNTRLHGVLRRAAPGAPAVVILHPHPQFGGNMNNNVVLGLEQECADAGFTTLRFNFRDTGRSTGAFDNGAGEQDDVRAAIALIADTDPGAPVIVAGYSFGAAVGLPVAANSARVAAMAGIAPPTVMADFSFLVDCEKPLLVIAGDSDSFCEHARLAMLLTRENHRFRLLQGVDHFYIGEELRAGKIVCDFIRDAVVENSGCG